MANMLIENQNPLYDSAAKRSKPLKKDWEELVEICYSSAQKIGETYEQSLKTLKHVRKLLDD